MNPKDVPYRDWNLYYGGTYMLYQGEPVYVGCPEPQMFHCKMLSTGKIHLLGRKEIEDLVIWWPQAGAYNLGTGNAGYIARRAHRSMRKSASPNHYYFKWGGGLDGRAKMFAVLARGPNYMTWSAAEESLAKRQAVSIAVARDLILSSRDKAALQVIYRGNPVGRLSKVGEYIPDIPQSPTTKLVLNRLYEENIIR